MPNIILPPTSSNHQNPENISNFKKEVSAAFRDNFNRDATSTEVEILSSPETLKAYKDFSESRQMLVNMNKNLSSNPTNNSYRNVISEDDITLRGMGYSDTTECYTVNGKYYIIDSIRPKAENFVEITPQEASLRAALVKNFDEKVSNLTNSISRQGLEADPTERHTDTLMQAERKIKADGKTMPYAEPERNPHNISYRAPHNNTRSPSN